MVMQVPSKPMSEYSATVVPLATQIDVISSFPTFVSPSLPALL